METCILIKLVANKNVYDYWLCFDGYYTIFWYFTNKTYKENSVRYLLSSI